MALWELFEETSKIMYGPGPRWVLHTLLRRLEHCATSGQSAALEMLGYEFAQALRQLNNRGRLYENEAAVPGVDSSKLHRSPKAKSGFVGVYSNGKGFRAEGADPKDPRSVVTIGTFPTAEGAAWARYRHYKQHGLIYGRLEEIVDKMRAQPELKGRDDVWLRHLAIWEAKNLENNPIEGLSDEEREMERVDPITGVRK